MGNYNTKSYQINNSAIKTVVSRKKKKTMNESNGIMQQFGCAKIVKRRGKEKPELKKCSMDNYDTLNDSTDRIKHDNSTPLDTNQNCNNSTLSHLFTERDNTTTTDLTDHTRDPLKAYNEEQIPNLSTTYRKLSETSLNSDDLMLSTDVNLDQADDDVSKDYNASEKDDPFISTLCDTSPKCEKDVSFLGCAEDSEKNDVVYLDSSRESSVSLHRKLGYGSHSRRPHSFSSPLSCDAKSKMKRSSNLSTVDSIDLAWTWMSASETANIAQEISNLKLVLLKTRRLLMDEYNNEQFGTLNEDNPSVFSEPNTPLYYNDQQNKTSTSEPENQTFKDWYNMDKDALIQELHDLSKRNASLQSQLNDKNRVIELLQDGRRKFHRPQARADSLIVSRIARSSTFDSYTMMNPLSPTQECSSGPMTLSKNSEAVQSESKNVDSGLYQSSSSTDSCVYQN